MKSNKLVDGIGMLIAVATLFPFAAAGEGNWVGKTDAQEASRPAKPEAIVHFSVGGVTCPI